MSTFSPLPPRESVRGKGVGRETEGGMGKEYGRKGGKEGEGEKKEIQIGCHRERERERERACARARRTAEVGLADLLPWRREDFSFF
jgi:hypothetical protein